LFQIRVGAITGTCFIVSLGYIEDGPEFGAAFATAWHVLDKIVGTREKTILVSADRSVVLDSDSDEVHEVVCWRLGTEAFDAALITVITAAPLLSESELLPMLPPEIQMARGAELGWLGFTGLAEPELCFFHGYISGYVTELPAYLVDGVAVSGVSGGPAFDNRAHLVGLISSYIPNQINRYITLPGLLTVVPIGVIRYWMEHKLQARIT